MRDDKFSKLRKLMSEGATPTDEFIDAWEEALDPRFQNKPRDVQAEFSKKVPVEEESFYKKKPKQIPEMLRKLREEAGAKDISTPQDRALGSSAHDIKQKIIQKGGSVVRTEYTPEQLELAREKYAQRIAKQADKPIIQKSLEAAKEALPEAKKAVSKLDAERILNYGKGLGKKAPGKLGILGALASLGSALSSGDVSAAALEAASIADPTGVFDAGREVSRRIKLKTPEEIEQVRFEDFKQALPMELKDQAEILWEEEKQRLAARQRRMGLLNSKKRMEKEVTDVVNQVGDPTGINPRRAAQMVGEDLSSLEDIEDNSNFRKNKKYK